MRGMPTLLAYSVNDRLIDEKVSEEMADMLGARPDHVAHFNKEGQVTSGQPLTQGQTGRLKVLKFDNGGHYAFLRQPTESNQAVASLIDYATMQTSSQLHREEEFVEKYETWANIRFV
ncbi:hypothetical protein HDE_09797 [Halotydeus destructor]|nr:hypothetical protein HDE_09797 [Halotydeus destructor]